ncbi:hypothetical protein [Enterobacter sp. 155105]|jgi:hypothetical protein|uniref:hypothetical protein n=1 Tax=Enterobacter sp. 155105 TaxID=2980499 RepID=UPI0021CB9591|nr:hypothetical protein [Enterobacter sp. 155105]UXP25867.1 hypothetical protein N8O08_09940 [Enterobacter sp. 155105]HDR2614996.1 hypothetical protein [Enterobacter asburiae]
MEVKKVSVEDYRADMGLMRGYSVDSQEIQDVKSFYYQEAVKQLSNLNCGIEIIREDENKNVLVFKVNEDLKFQLTLLNNIKYLSVDLHAYQKNNRYEDVLSEQYHYHCKGDSDYKFSDVEEHLEYDRVGQHFRHMLVCLIKEIAKIED